ncbi:6-hydroxymethylpterin diphosphokinase MptE-like protein [Halobacterium wangiae]|uniref:6-hydroxymethylpterin diphosphokinase MptE-like protein n=1 Tax=Halobacterium wangiae TaxID=2902623 RepID=UPI001E36E602|nr:6-hydroxymethylpterin diphosphokinase MptE-like protein [Halobacterium wangiae]
MEFDDWEPVYETILADFGYPRAADERARDVLAEYVDQFDVSRLDCAGERVAIAGGAPALADETDVAATADRVFAASTAVDVLADAGVDVDVMVTDLDKNPGTARRLTEAGVPVAAHAHGDNVPAVREHVPTFDADHVLGTTQAEPAGPVRNFGGFTDGDRAAFLADHCGAAELVFPGWDFEDPDVGPEKAKKLAWAERLLYWLESRRGERFGVLDGRRAGIRSVVE